MRKVRSPARLKSVKKVEIPLVNLNFIAKRRPTKKEKLLQGLILHDWSIIDKKLREKVEDGTETQLSALHSYLKSAMDLVKV